MKKLSIVFIYLLLTGVMVSQYQLKRSVVGNGGGKSSGIANQLSGTSGQIQGKMLESNNQNHVGFWYFLPDVPDKPIVATAIVSNIDFTTALSGGEVIDDLGFAISERGIVFSTSPNPTTADNKVIDGSPGLGSFISNISGLLENQVYYVRAYAVNSEGTGYGEEFQFTTIPTLGEWGLIILGSITAFLGAWFVYRNKVV